jgi:DNA-binding transcriptional ArsR family regulator
MEEKEIRVIKFYKALSNPTRYKILKMLMNNNICVNELAQKTRKTAQTVSEHLRILKNLDLVKYHMEKKKVIYEIKKTKLLNEIIKIEEIFIRGKL